MNYIKPYLTQGDQATLLQSRGMKIDDLDKAKACLSRINYYRLSAYWYPFRKSEVQVDPLSGAPKKIVLNDFRDDTDFVTIMELYVFDKKLRMIVMDALERVEVAVRADITLQLGKVSPWAHRDPAALDGKFARTPHPTKPASTQHQEWLANIDEKARRSKEDFVKHFTFKYAGERLPLWMTSELWDFGALSIFYSGMKRADRDAIARRYGANLTGREFSSWLRCLNDVRNVCAHHSRLWNRPLSSQPRWTPTGQFPDLDKLGPPAAGHRLYSAIVVLHVLLCRIHPSTPWLQRLSDHLKTLPQNPIVTLSSAGFGAGWEAQFGI
ncbi:Abi family protein [Asticcacaulis sp.]|uniref:Abi family protein n=1 Tax=Asticcacaulis sp. TaxID=1872648 RepID=UPI003F7C4783